MKYIKIILLMIGAVALTTACGDDNENFGINTVDSTVQFSNTSVSLKESTNYVNLPIEINGSNRNGFIKINAALKSNPSELDLDREVVVTSYSFVVPADRQSVNLEVGLHVYTLDIERGRNISFEITNVEGATLGANTSCTINIIEKNAAEGLFLIKGINPIDGERQDSGTWNFVAGDESYDKMTMDIGLGEKVKVAFTELIPDSRYTIRIEPFQLMGKFTVNGKSQDVYLTCAKYNEQTKKLEVYKEDPIRGSFARRVADDKETVTITISDGFGLGYYNEEEDFIWFFYNCYKPGAVMTKNQ
jgi:hypothetical protein